MNFKNGLANKELLRRIIIPILRALDFRFRWRHDVTHRRFYLLMFLHKGYWFYGSGREKNELVRFGELIRRGDTVLEIGAHIGYVTQIFEDLVGKTGKVVAVEPTESSREFLSKNVGVDTQILPIAVSDFVAEADFYTEDFGGFTNSLVREFVESSNDRLAQSQLKTNAPIKKLRVSTSTVDTICEQNGLSPKFIKIDVEGAELAVLAGAQQTLRNTYALMVEVTRNHEKVYDLLLGSGFKAMSCDGFPIENTFPGGNIFFVKGTEYSI